MAYKSKIEQGFEAKLKAAVEARDWSEVAALNFPFGAALLLTESGRVLNGLVTSYAFADSVNAREIEDTEMLSPISTDIDEDIED